MLDGGRAVIWMREVDDAAEDDVITGEEVDVVKLSVVDVVVGTGVLDRIGSVHGDGMEDEGTESMASEGFGALATGGV